MNYIPIHKKYLTEKLNTLNMCFLNYKITLDDEFVLEEYGELVKIENMLNTNNSSSDAQANRDDKILNYLKLKYPELRRFRNLSSIQNLYKFLTEKLGEFYKTVKNYADECVLNSNITSKNYYPGSKLDAEDAISLLEKLDEIYEDGGIKL